MAATLKTDTVAFSLPRVREEAIVLIRKLIRLMETLKPLPPRKVVSLKLFYYDDVTPPAFQPTGFEDCTNDAHAFFSVPPLKVSMGSVASVRALCCHGAPCHAQFH